eukprot:COSAG03_NODE_19406_length_337_cov_0.697479_1_plen_40_part_10
MMSWRFNGGITREAHTVTESGNEDLQALHLQWGAPFLLAG